jgi:hypothetical protein
MQPPEDWIDELAWAIEPEVFEEPPFELALTFRMSLPGRLADEGTTIDAVADDLRGGFTSDRRGREEDRYYCLSSSGFDVFVKSQPEEETGAPLAVITSVRTVQRLARRIELPAAEVTVHPPYHQAFCDIGEVHEAVRRAQERANRRRRLRGRAAQLLGRTPPGSIGHGDLHGMVRRQYSAFRTVVDLLREHNEAEGAVRVSGAVIDAKDVPGAENDLLVCVELDRTSVVLRPGMDVTVRSGRRTWRLEVADAEDALLYLWPPERGNLEPGTRIEVEYQESFRLGKHSLALSRFLDEDVIGDWTALAGVLCTPEAIATPLEQDALTYYDTELNSRQRAAVDGAVNAPHAFFVQGPPGTGKTTVITEIIRQLVARGERVLLVASMHVAVDEVLRRVADADGVFALRYSTDDSKVRDDLRRFMPDNVTTEFAQRATRPGRSKAPHWRAEINRLSDECRRLSALLDARSVRLAADTALAQAVSAQEQWQAAHSAAMVAAEGAVRAARQRSDEAAAAWREMAAIEYRLGSELTAAIAGQSFWARIAGVFGRGPLAPLRAEHHRVRQALAAAQGHHDVLARATDQAAWHQRVTGERGVREGQQHSQNRARRADRARVAADALWAAEVGARPLLADSDPAAVPDERLAALVVQQEARMTKLRHYIDLEVRWHEITGIHNQTPQGVEHVLNAMGDELLQAANLVCCTATGFGGQPAIRDSDFDTLIVDEASRVIDSEFLISARQARRWVLVGDEHQLPPYVHGPDEHHLHALAALHMVDRGAANDLQEAVNYLNALWREDEELHRLRTEPVRRHAERLLAKGDWARRYRKPFGKAYERFRQDDDAERALLGVMRTHLVQSLFERCVRACSPRLRVRLTEQRRMIEPIAAIVREPVYRGAYTTPPPDVLERHGVSPLIGETLDEPVVLLDTSGQPKADEEQRGTGFVNVLEASWAVAVCRMWERELRRRGEPKRVTVSVLTLYGAQAALLRRELGHPHYPEFRALKIEKVDSIDAIQGQESDLVLLSFCRTRRGRMGEGFGLWLQDIRRLNVACTRAKRGLVIIGHRRTLSRLSAIQEAQAFYRHLFSLFDGDHPGTLVLKELRSSM